VHPPLARGVDDNASAPGCLDGADEGIDLPLGVVGLRPFVAGAVELEVQGRWQGGVVHGDGLQEVGRLVATLGDKLSATGEKMAKSFIFLPMAISFVGAATIWNLVYAYQDAGRNQTGLLNAIVVALGGSPQTWYQIDTARLNTLLLQVILIWLQTGFAMVLISSAIKAVPEDTIEAGRMDGAGELKIFWRIIFPQVMPTLLSVFVTVLILVLKVFDIIYVTTNGNYNTDVIANLFFRKLFTDQQAGQASAIVVVLLILVTPILIYQVHAFRQQEANR
jgi:alpha-glucoside transport system permease protein